jgi:hypothetical protein
LFKKNAPPRPAQDKETFYQLAKSVAPARADSHHDDDSINSPSIAPVDESPKATSPPTYTFNPQIRESRKLPKSNWQQPEKDTRPRALTLGVSSPETKAKLTLSESSPETKTKLTLGVSSPVIKTKTSLLRSASSPKVLSKDSHSYKDSPTLPQLVVSGGSAKSSPGASSGMPLLDVDIPSVRMERYSVMFGNLLQQNTCGQNSGGSSALLQRRQGNSEKLKPLDPLSTKVRCNAKSS